MLTLLAAFQQADSAFPSGGFAFSNGLEGLAALGEPLDAAGLSRFLEASLRHRWATADRVALLRAFQAGEDRQAVVAIDREVEATAIAEPFRVGSRRNGTALLAAHARIGTPRAADYRAEVLAGRAYGHLSVVQGLVHRAAGLGEAEAVAVSAYQAAAGVVAAAVRLGLVGAIDAQRVLTGVLAIAADLAAAAPTPDTEIASFVPLFEIAAIRGARADLRLFSN